MGADRALLKGITLSDAQKAQLKELRDTQRANMQANGEANGAQGRGGANFEAMRTARQNGDTATMRRLMQEQRTEMQARQMQQIAAMRGILTSDQLTQFDANVAEMKSHMGENGQMGLMGPGGMRGAGRGRGARPPKP
jgi:Spy/CpxP family protein refolding chaperone